MELSNNLRIAEYPIYDSPFSSMGVIDVTMYVGIRNTDYTCPGGENMSKKLYRSRTKRMVSGVCGGLAEYFDIDETIIRLGVAFVICITAVVPGVLFYLAAAIIIPESPV